MKPLCVVCGGLLQSDLNPIPRLKLVCGQCRLTGGRHPIRNPKSIYIAPGDSNEEIKIDNWTGKKTKFINDEREDEMTITQGEEYDKRS